MKQEQDMNKIPSTVKKILIIGLLLIAGFGAYAGFTLWQELSRVASDDPLVWQSTVSELLNKTEVSNPPEDSVLFVGSSSIRFWDTLEQDMAPLPVIQHGFGGAKIFDVVFFAEELITRWQPDKVVIFVGSNDINASDEHQFAPTHIAEQLKELLTIIFAAKPDTEVFYLSITPTLYSWDKWESVQQANRMAEQVCESFDQVTFIDTTDLFLNEEGSPDKSLFIFDGLHLNQNGYALWTQRIKPYLLED